MNERDKFIADVFGVTQYANEWWFSKYVTNNPGAMKTAWDTCMTQWKLSPLRYKP